jgi:Ca2+/Na+ antiporter
MERLISVCALMGLFLFLFFFYYYQCVYEARKQRRGGSNSYEHNVQVFLNYLKHVKKEKKESFYFPSHLLSPHVYIINVHPIRFRPSYLNSISCSFSFFFVLLLLLLLLLLHYIHALTHVCASRMVPFRCLSSCYGSSSFKAHPPLTLSPAR